MTATIIDGKALAARVRAEVARGVQALVEQAGRAPGLATVLVGEDPGSAVYVSGKQRACGAVGMESFDHRLPADTPFDEVTGLLASLNADPAVSGVLLQLPVPDHLDGTVLTGTIDPGKDVDGLTPVNAGLLSLGRPGLRPCTPSGVMALLASVDATVEGSEAVVVGRSNLFGKPMAQLLLEVNATVTVCHSRTRDLREVCARADILVAAVGRPRLIERAFVKPGAIVIDVGMNRLDTDRRSIPHSGHTAGSPIVGTAAEGGGQADRSKLDTPFGAHGGSSNRPASGLVGDVDFEAVSEVASAITPVPGGVGPMTIAMLLRNTLQAARTQAGLDSPCGGQARKETG
jgi:methylenetetrahydrofolate dehydrogenase (NADP+)/methenyltetrahydrofolate cyclohydrolase